MEQSFVFDFGEQKLPMTIRAGQITVLEATTPPPVADLAETFRRAVEEDAVAAPPLKTLITPEDAVTIIISDLTRAWMHQERIAPLLMRYLHEQAKVPYENICFLVALGTHRKMTEEELRRLVTDDVYDKVAVVNHAAEERLICVGTTSRGTEVCVNPLVVGRKVILMGGTVHHLLAGYGGGRKSILPGVCGDKTIQHNHMFALDPVLPKSSDRVGCGRLEGNPVHEDMMEAAAMVNPVFGINLVVDGQGQLIALPCGDYEKAWLESCRLVDRYNGVPLAEQVDAVVTSCGGFPKDINLYQSSKTLINAYQAVKEGGQLIFLSECREGGGPAAFFDWSRYQAEGRLDAALRENFTIAGYIFYACCEIAAHTDCHVLSMIDRDTLSSMNMKGHSSPEEISQLLDFGDKHVVVMPHGSSTVPIVKKS